MAEKEMHDAKKRKGSDLSSELDSSINSPAKTEAKTHKKKKPKNNSEKALKEFESSQSEQKDTTLKAKEQKEQKMASELNRQLTEINKKLSNVITKDDGVLRELIRDIFQQMKDELLQGVSHRIELLEGKLFEKDEENDKLKKEITSLNKNLEDQKAENQKLVDQIQTVNDTAEARINDLEQYGRRNNLRISGVPENQHGDETAEMTTRKVADTLNGTITDLNLARYDFDIAHRLGPKRRDSCRPIIVKFQSRMNRDTVLRNRKLFKGSDIYINEDLTRLNQLVLACVRKKMPDEVDKVWTRNGRIVYKNKTNHVHEVKYADYQDWIDLEWPEPEANSGMR